MSSTSSMERYKQLGLLELLSRKSDYPSACRDLGFILRSAFKKFPKNLQSIVFDDALAAFRLLPEMHSSHGITGARALVRAAEAVLPKQKKSLAVAEFKHAIVACKRIAKTPEDQQCSVQLPQDVLVHIFSFLDLLSLAAVGLVCWSWNSAANDNMLWQLQYTIFFGKSDHCYEIYDKCAQLSSDRRNVVSHQLKKEVNQTISLDWKETFKRAFTGSASRRSRSNWGYCTKCKSITWIKNKNMKCSKLQHSLVDKKGSWDIEPMSDRQVVKYLLGESLLEMSSSDSDSDSHSDSDGLSLNQHLLKRWAYAGLITWDD